MNDYSNEIKQPLDPESMRATGEITQEFADSLASTAIEQLRISRDNKRARLAQIRESEDLYFGVVKKSLRNPFNESFPYMSGFVDHLLAKIDDPPRAEYTHVNLEDYKLARKYTALYEKESNSNLPHASWAKKDRWVKKFAIFSGLGIYGFYTESYPEYRNCLYAIDYYDFHFEPGGGGDLEQHLFCGQDFIFKTGEELISGAQDGFYDSDQVAQLVTKTPKTDLKDNASAYEDRYNRHRAFGLDPQTNNYTGQEVFKLVQWVMTYNGQRYYVLFDETTQLWVRIKRWKDTCSSGLYPYIVWQTHEEASTLMAKAPADDARPIARTLNRLLNQELYNREKKNTGQRLYDPDMIEDIEDLMDNRPDGLIPVNTMKGTRQLDRALSRVEHGDLSNTLDLVSFLDSFSGQKMGSTPGSQGTAEKDKKVGIFFGELKQVEERLGLYNKSYKEAWGQIALRLAQNAKDHLKTRVKVKLMGPNGLEEDEITPDEATKDIEFDVKITGGSEESEKQEVENTRKTGVLTALQTVNPRWKEEQIMKLNGFGDNEIKDAFNPMPPATMELLSEAAQAIKEIVLGRTPALNLGANLAYMQKIIQDATDFTHSNPQKEMEIKSRLYDFANAHTQIVAENEARNAMKVIQENQMKPAEEKPAGGGARELFNVNTPVA